MPKRAVVSMQSAKRSLAPVRNMLAADVQRSLAALANPSKAKILQGFFKTGKGQYGEGGRFLGVTVPQQRVVAKAHLCLSLPEVQTLLDSSIHEHRLTGLLILTYQYAAAEEAQQKSIFDFYLKNARKINNWDLVDCSAPNIVGTWLTCHPKERSILRRMSLSENLWERRIATVSTLAFIRVNEFDDTLAIAELLLRDKHDLMHKATGWMLREVGKRDAAVLRSFLNKHAHIMPRTMLRYAIERFEEKERKHYLELKHC